MREFIAFLFVFFIVAVSGYASTFSTCTLTTSALSDFVETSFEPLQDLLLTELKLCIAGGVDTTMHIYEWNGTQNTGFQSGILYTSTSVVSGASCATGGGTYQRVLFDNALLEAGTKYWFAWNTPGNTGSLWSRTPSCGSLSPQGLNTDWVSLRWTYGDLIGLVLPSNELQSPADGSIANQTFDVINNVTLADCANVTLFRAFRFCSSSGCALIENNNTILAGDSVETWEITTVEFGRGFQLLSFLTCENGADVIALDTNNFNITLTDTIASKTNLSAWTNIYDKLCFFTAEPTETCGTNLQDFVVYLNDTLYWSVNDTNEITFCIQDNTLDGWHEFRVENFCSDNGDPIDSFVLVINMMVQLGARAGSSFTGFMIGFAPPASDLVIKLGFAVFAILVVMAIAFVVKNIAS